MKVVLITGARGFVGASMIEHLIESTNWTIYYTRRPSKENNRLDQIILKDRVHVWNGEKIDIILHIAGNASSISCIENPAKAVDDNIIETIKTLEIAKKYNVEHFVYFSSVEVYGKGGLCYEDDVCIARNMYAATKHAGEQMCRAYQSSYGLPCSIIRINNTFGRFCQEERFPVIAVRKLLKNEKFTIYTHDGQVVGRRWTSIYDVAEMVCFILEQLPGKTYNTTGDFMTNLQFLECIANAMNIEHFEYQLIEENIAGRIGNQDAPPDFIRSLGWKPTKTFNERIRDFVTSI
jgi:UDP-glucose 4,6-dehydratase